MIHKLQNIILGVVGGAIILTLLLFIGVVLDNPGVVDSSNASLNETAAKRTAETITPATLYNVVSEQRRLNGVPVMTFSEELNLSAADKCNDMVAGSYYEHTNPANGFHGYQFIPKRLANTAYSSENLNQGNLVNTKEVVDSWLGSPAHKAAMLDPKYTHTGFAVCTVNGKPTFVEHFASIQEPQPVYQTPQYQPTNTMPMNIPTYQPPVTCYTNYNTIGARTTCY
jgi:hypothetical protein